MSKMPPVPEPMKRNGRPIDIDFHPDEYLYRRVHTKYWDAPDLFPTVDAMLLPDISVGRSRYGHPEWVRIDTITPLYFKKWGVIGVRHKKIPLVFQLDGGPVFTFKVEHVPLEDDYTHSEVQAFEGKSHLDEKEKVPEALDLEWRVLLLEACEVMIPPRQDRAIRQHAPSSHEPEPQD